MFYKTSEPHGLAYNPFKAIVAPRPIGWLSTLSKDGLANLAPYSFFNGVSDKPEMVMFASWDMKDSATNVRDTGEFTCNYVSRKFKDEMNISSGPHAPGIDEFEQAGLEKAPGITVKCPRVSVAAAALECKMLEIVTPKTLGGENGVYHIVIGQVTGVHIADDMITNGRFDVQKADPIMRAGYMDYVGISDLFEMRRPDQ